MKIFGVYGEAYHFLNNLISTKLFTYATKLTNVPTHILCLNISNKIIISLRKNFPGVLIQRIHFSELSHLKYPNKINNLGLLLANFVFAENSIDISKFLTHSQNLIDEGYRLMFATCDHASKKFIGRYIKTETSHKLLDEAKIITELESVDDLEYVSFKEHLFKPKYTNDLIDCHIFVTFPHEVVKPTLMPSFTGESKTSEFTDARFAQGEINITSKNSHSEFIIESVGSKNTSAEESAHNELNSVVITSEKIESEEAQVNVIELENSALSDNEKKEIIDLMKENNLREIEIDSIPVKIEELNANEQQEPFEEKIKSESEPITKNEYFPETQAEQIIYETISENNELFQIEVNSKETFISSEIENDSSKYIEDEKSFKKDEYEAAIVLNNIATIELAENVESIVNNEINLLVEGQSDDLEDANSDFLQPKTEEFISDKIEELEVKKVEFEGKEIFEYENLFKPVEHVESTDNNEIHLVADRVSDDIKEISLDYLQTQAKDEKNFSAKEEFEEKILINLEFTDTKEFILKEDWESDDLNNPNLDCFQTEIEEDSLEHVEEEKGEIVITNDDLINVTEPKENNLIENTELEASLDHTLAYLQAEGEEEFLVNINEEKAEMNSKNDDSVNFTENITEIKIDLIENTEFDDLDEPIFDCLPVERDEVLLEYIDEEKDKIVLKDDDWLDLTDYSTNPEEDALIEADGSDDLKDFNFNVQTEIEEYLSEHAQEEELDNFEKLESEVFLENEESFDIPNNNEPTIESESDLETSSLDYSIFEAKDNVGLIQKEEKKFENDEILNVIENETLFNAAKNYESMNIKDGNLVVNKASDKVEDLSSVTKRKMP